MPEQVERQALQSALTAGAAEGTDGVAAAYDQAFWWSIGFTAVAVALSLALPGRPSAEAPDAAAQQAAPTARRAG